MFVRTRQVYVLEQHLHEVPVRSSTQYMVQCSAYFRATGHGAMPVMLPRSTMITRTSIPPANLPGQEQVDAIIWSKVQ